MSKDFEIINEIEGNEEKADDLKTIVKQTAFNLNAVSEQMGLVNAKLKAHEGRLASLENKTSLVASDLGNFKEYVKENEYIEPEKVDKLKIAMGNRVVDLLSGLNLSKSEFGEYYGKFMSKFWWDCKKHSYAVGKAGVYTKNRHYEDLMKYIGEWQPEGYGSAVGYINHLKVKKRRES